MCVLGLPSKKGPKKNPGNTKYIFSESTDYSLSNAVWHHHFQNRIALQPEMKAWKEPHRFFMKLNI